MRRSLRSIARHLGRSASTISREVQRNGGTDRYRAAQSDHSAWDPQALQAGLPSFPETDSIETTAEPSEPDRRSFVLPSGCLYF
uniref:helix-turn-helix domain-containing protein n=1 Tax=Tardiphaga robiniae TaxID=943830 RepID=UPI0035B53755